MTLQPSYFKIEAIQFSKINFEKFELLEKVEIRLEQNLAPTILTLDDNKLLVILNSSLLAIAAENNKKIFSFDIEIQGHFKILKEDLETNHKLHRNLVSIVFSYIRPIIAQITALSGLPPLNLPPLDLSKIEIYYPEPDEIEK